MDFLSRFITIFISSILSVIFTVYVLTNTPFKDFNDTNNNTIGVNKETQQFSNQHLDLPNLIKKISSRYENSIVLVESDPSSDIDFYSYGSGFVFEYKDKQYVLTNEHVVGSSKFVYIEFKDKKRIKTEVIGTDFDLDLAVLKLPPTEDRIPLTFANSEKLSIGDWAIAMGNPKGLEFSVSLGIVSQFERELFIQDHEYHGLIQTDAAINPGSSGGPLVNLEGNVIGINTAIMEDAQGLGFAVASNYIVEVLDSLIEKGYVERPFIGVYLQNSEEGITVPEVMPNSPAEIHGVKKHDIIVSIDGKNVFDIIEFTKYIDEKKVGETIELEILRNDEKMKIEVVIGNKHEISQQN